MRRYLWIAVVVSVAVLGSVLVASSLGKDEVNRFPKPPTPSVAPDGTRTYTIQPGTLVNFSPEEVDPGDVVICKGKGRASVPPIGSPDVNVGGLILDIDQAGSLIASCEPHPVGEM